MLDVREILKALDPDDRAIWSQHRSEMRRSYLNAHNPTVGIAKWDTQDDAFLDLIDIRLALLFDRAGRLDSVKEVANIKDSTTIENDLYKTIDNIKSKVNNEIVAPDITPATKLMQTDWRMQN
jgi:hypothetical protein